MDLSGRGTDKGRGKKIDRRGEGAEGVTGRGRAREGREGRQGGGRRAGRERGKGSVASERIAFKCALLVYKCRLSTGLHPRTSSMNCVKWRTSRLVSDSVLPRLHH